MGTALVVLCTLSITVQQQQQQSCPSNSGSSQGCLAKQCLACANAPANCTVHQTNGTVRCSGDTSTCSVITCDSCSHCGSYYFKSSDNHVDYRFTSGCISNDPTYTCDSSTYACVGSGLVMNESALFSSSPISCSCLASNCTANLSFTYIVNTTQPAQATSFPGPTMITYPIMTSAADSKLEPYNIAIIFLSIVLFIAFSVALAIIVATIKKSICNAHPV